MTKSNGTLSAAEAQEIAINGYIYAYPLVLMELTRRIATNVAVPASAKAPMNQFNHMPSFPDASFTEVVRPNADTLYSILWFNVAKEPLLIEVPEAGNRYYLLEMLDMWTDVFDSPGTRTTGSAAQSFAITGPAWAGRLPSGVKQIRSPTALGWIVGRTQTNGQSDYDKVHKFQAAMKAAPLSHWREPYRPPKGTVNASWDMKTPPVGQIAKLKADCYFSLFTELTKLNPPHANDNPILHQMQRLGVVAGEPTSLSTLSVEAGQAIARAGEIARRKIADVGAKSGVLTNGWRSNLTAIGTYGTDYLHRASVAHFGLGANPIEDAVYPTAFADGEGKTMMSDIRYMMHFTKDQIPPVRGFWSLTMYNQEQLFADNPINRYSIGNRDDLHFNRDGSLDLYIQRESPGKDKECNWLPAPESGSFTMNLRLYWPKSTVTDGTWAPPPIERAQ